MSFARSLRMSLGIGAELYLRHRPFLLYLKPTPRCDLRCATCNRWQDQGGRDEELSLGAIRDLLVKFRRAGCQVLTLWGGEPTLRRDLAEIFAAAKALGFKTSMCTNANHLATRAAELLPHLDVLLCSLDGIGATHDELRGVPGLFDRVVRGIETAARATSCTTKIWASVHRRNLEQLGDLARLAAGLGVGIEFFPISPIAGFNDELVLDAAARAEAFAEIQRIKRQGLPVRNPDAALRLMQSGEPFRCNFGRIAIQVDHRGSVHACEDATGRPLHVWGDVATIDLESLYASPEYREVSRRLSDCGKCRLPCVMELSNNLTASLAGMFWQSLRR